MYLLIREIYMRLREQRLKTSVDSLIRRKYIQVVEILFNIIKRMSSTCKVKH